MGSGSPEGPPRDIYEDGNGNVTDPEGHMPWLLEQFNCLRKLEAVVAAVGRCSCNRLLIPF